jgi:hypothetical protein
MTQQHRRGNDQVSYPARPERRGRAVGAGDDRTAVLFVLSSPQPGIQHYHAAVSAAIG